MALISVIIPARESASVIAECLDSLAAQTRKPDEVIVVDDGSLDSTSALVREKDPAVRLIALAQSLGFAGACEAGLKVAKGEWIAVLNSDTVAHPGWLEEMLAATELEPRVGMVASRVLLFSPAGAVDSLGLRVDRGGMASLRGHGEPDRPDEALPVLEEVLGPAGSAALYSRAMLSEIGFFAPDFFAYYEDVDLALRARRRGYRCLLANRARVIHHHSYSADRVGLKKRYFLQSNRLRAIIRNWPLGWILGNLPFIIIGNFLGLAAALLEGQFPAALQARVRVIKSLPRDLSFRHSLQADRPEDLRSLRAWLRADHLPFREGADE